MYHYNQGIQTEVGDWDKDLRAKLQELEKELKQRSAYIEVRMLVNSILRSLRK